MFFEKSPLDVNGSVDFHLCLFYNIYLSCYLIFCALPSQVSESEIRAKAKVTKQVSSPVQKQGET